jgi:regulatory protein YycH of two-component signal transduction system YycFG
MMEKVKTGVLAALVILSLVQSYLLAYSMPGLGTTISSTQDYVNAEPMGQEEKVENLIFPEDIVLHMGKGKHTVFYPGMNFYNLIYSKIQSREFKGFQQSPLSVLDWNEVKGRDPGVELRFGSGVPVELLSKALKLEGDMQFTNDVINRIWIFESSGREEVRTYFFSADGTKVYESVKADLTAQDVQMYVGYGEYQTEYENAGDDLYTPVGPVEAQESIVSYMTYSPEQMQHNLFFDPGVTRTISDRSGSQIYTDGKRGLQVEQNGKWISYTDPVAGQGQDDSESDNVYESIKFINQHGGWDGLHRFVHSGPLQAQSVRFQQYYSTQFYGAYPIIPSEPFQFGEIKLRLQQGVVSEYERSLITLQKKAVSQDVRWLPGGQTLKDELAHYSRRSEVKALYPAVLASPVDDNRLKLEPVWAVRLFDGSQQVLLPAIPGGYKPKPGERGGAPLVPLGSAGDGAADAGASAAGAADKSSK